MLGPWKGVSSLRLAYTYHATRCKSIHRLLKLYRRFIKDFSSIARPLHDLTKKDMPWQWHTEQQCAFNTLKEKFCQEPILKVYNPNLPTRVEADTSGFATGGILSQKYPDGLWHPMCIILAL
jgi:hypothetical protein